jgi:Cdc6-like AAA superfamily ATPase
MGRLMGLEEAVEKLRAALSMGVPPEREIMRTIFVDREEELKKLVGDLESVTGSGRGGVRLITGDAGYGKSAIIEYIKDYAFEHQGIAFSLVEMRELIGSRPSELIPSLYRMIIDRVEDREGRRGRELMTAVSKALLERYSGKLDAISFRFRNRLSPKVREKFERLGNEAVSRALALMTIDHLNPVAYDYLTGTRGLEPDEAREFERVLGCRTSWRLQREEVTEALVTVARAMREAGMKALAIAIDELEALEDVKKDLLSKFLAEFTVLVDASVRSPVYMIIASTPGFWSGDKKSVRALYPFLHQRLNMRRIDLSGFKEADARALAWRLVNLYERAYGRSAVEGIEANSLGSDAFKSVQPLGHPRGILQYLMDALDERVVRAK